VAPPLFGSPDVRLLFTTRVVRLFAYGYLALVLGLYLEAAGYSKGDIGLIMTLTLAGDTVISLWLTTTADRVGRKRMLLIGAALMVLGGAVFAATDNFVLLVLAGTVGVLSPSGNEVGPFLAIEQAALAQVVEPEQRTRVFAWYTLVGSFATGAGWLVCGHVVQALQTAGLRPLDSYRVVLVAYAATGAVLALLFLLLSAAAEAPAGVGPTAAPRLLGLHRSRHVVLVLSALFTLDAFAGGFVVLSLVELWFKDTFGADPGTLGNIFFAANVLAGLSALAAVAIARRVGLLRTMVFTHVPSNVLLILVPLMPNLPLAVAMLLLRFAISQMDVPARQAYTAALVDPDERSAAAGVTGVARTTGAAVSPYLGGLLLGVPALAGGIFIVSGVLKLLYDGLVYLEFRNVPLAEESRPAAKV
jgi:MFS family permease